MNTTLICNLGVSFHPKILQTNLKWESQIHFSVPLLCQKNRCCTGKRLHPLRRCSRISADIYCRNTSPLAPRHFRTEELSDWHQHLPTLFLGIQSFWVFLCVRLRIAAFHLLLFSSAVCNKIPPTAFCSYWYRQIAQQLFPFCRCV